MKALLVGGDAQAIEDIAATLRQVEPRCAVERLASREELIQRLTDQRADLVVVDADSPASGGLAALERVRSIQPNAPVILLSSLAGEEAAFEAGRAGAFDYVLKGRPDRLAASARSALGKARRDLGGTAALVRSGGVPYQRIVDTAREGIWVIDAAGNTTYANQRMAEMLGVPVDEMLGRSFFSFMDETARDLAIAHLERRKQGFSEQHEFRFKTASGADLWALISTNSLVDEDGVFLGALGMITDITDRRRAEDALRNLAEQLAQSERQFRQLVERASDLTVLLNVDGTVRYASPSVASILGYTPEEIVGQQLLRLVPPSDARSLVELDRLRSGPRRLDRAEFQLLHKNGSVCNVEASAMSMVDDLDAVALNFRDITERKRAELLHLAKEEAERASRAKSDFLSRMSHELRTPMNAILGFAQLLERAPDVTAKQKERVQYILNAGKHLLHLINEVLDISRIESGKVTLSTEPVDSSEVLGEVLDLIHPLAVRQSLSLRSEVDKAEHLHVLADRQQLKQVLVNLVANAVKYNRESGSVTVSCAAVSAGRVRIRVRDTGPGIPPERMGQLFMPFERLGAERSSVEGAGLGLALSKRLVELMGGAIGVDSAVGAGSTFWVELPMVESPLERARTTLPSALLDSTVRPLGAARTVLYIEDNLSNQRLIEDIVTRWPELRLLSATTGERGLKLAREQKPDLILLDINLPDVNGSDALEWLRRAPETSSIPVVIISADATKHQIEGLLASGATAYLTKPVDIRLLIDVVEGHLAPRARDV